MINLYDIENIELAIKPVHTENVYLGNTSETVSVLDIARGTMEFTVKENEGIIIPNKKAIVVDNKPVEVVGKNYKLLTNEDMLNSVVDGINESGLKTDGMYTKVQFDGRKTLVSFMFPEHKIAFDGDETDFTIIAKNGYGGISFGLLAGGFRIACLNGQIVGDYVSAYRSKHTQSLNLENMIQRIAAMEQAFKHEGALWIRYSKTPISQATAVAEIKKFLGMENKLIDVNAPGRQTSFHKLMSVWNEYSTEMSSNYWALFNTFTHFSTHGTGDKGISISTRMDREKKVRDIQRDWELRLVA